MSERNRRESTNHQVPSVYREWIHLADEVIAGQEAEPRPDNWQQLALEWCTSNETERSALASYIATYHKKLGVVWARELLRLEVLLQANDQCAIVTHYKRALRAYPRCALIEAWVAGHILRHDGAIWQAREMCLNAAAELPTLAIPFYELGFIHYLLGDFAGALEHYDQAAMRVTAEEADQAARIFYNRAMMQLALTNDKQAAIAGIKEALHYKPDYAQAKETLRDLKHKWRWFR
jgi:tetratricopeptide (TPR) repeat protein